MKDRENIPLTSGLQTTGLENGLPLPAMAEWQNWRAGRGTCQLRPGFQHVDRIANGHTVLTLDGTTQNVTIPYNALIHNLKRVWTIEALANPAALTTTRTVLGVAHATDYSCIIHVLAAGNVEAKVQDSAATVTTLTSTSTYAIGTNLAIQVVRLGTALTLRVNGATEDTDTMADLDCKAPGGDLYIGRNNTFLGWQGVIDYVRCLDVARADQAYGKMRLTDPGALYVRWDYPVESEDTTRCLDRSRFENHGTIVGAPASGTPLCTQTMFGTGIETWLDADGKQRVFIGGERHVYMQEMAR